MGIKISELTSYDAVQPNDLLVVAHKYGEGEYLTVNVTVDRLSSAMYTDALKIAVAEGLDNKIGNKAAAISTVVEINNKCNNLLTNIGNCVKKNDPSDFTLKGLITFNTIPTVPTIGLNSSSNSVMNKESVSNLIKEEAAMALPHLYIDSNIGNYKEYVFNINSKSGGYAITELSAWNELIQTLNSTFDNPFQLSSSTSYFTYVTQHDGYVFFDSNLADSTNVWVFIWDKCINCYSSIDIPYKSDDIKENKYIVVDYFSSRRGSLLYVKKGTILVYALDCKRTNLDRKPVANSGLKGKQIRIVEYFS